MIDRIREDIEQRLEQLLVEADRLREALSALGSQEGGGAAPARRRARSSTPRGRATGARSSGATGRGAGAQQRRASQTRGGRQGAAQRSRRRATGAADGASRTRTASGATRRAVLEALAKSDQPLTAGQVASATGLGRPSVSTTLSKLARSGDVTKAQRGYTIAANGSG